ncbi:hypothetical protein C8R42DRAFT_206402 [Lentinula raphanica]|nr:hypothetical protein C8R42DRAFT_206402 [Lentinula raphanica]
MLTGSHPMAQSHLDDDLYRCILDSYHHLLQLSLFTSFILIKAGPVCQRPLFSLNLAHRFTFEPKANLFIRDRLFLLAKIGLSFHVCFLSFSLRLFRECSYRQLQSFFSSIALFTPGSIGYYYRHLPTSSVYFICVSLVPCHRHLLPITRENKPQSVRTPSSIPASLLCPFKSYTSTFPSSNNVPFHASPKSPSSNVSSVGHGLLLCEFRPRPSIARPLCLSGCAPRYKQLANWVL